MLSAWFLKGKERAFNKKKYQDLILNGGKFDHTGFSIDSIRSNSPGNGFGTAVFRAMALMSKEQPRITLQVSTTISDTRFSNPILFYLYMGMIPSDTTPYDYLSSFAKIPSSAKAHLACAMKTDTLENFEKLLADDTTANTDSQNRQVFNILCAILHKEKRDEYPDKNIITINDIYANKPFLDEKLQSKIPYYKPFIAEILYALKEYSALGTHMPQPRMDYIHPRKSILFMELSSEGSARWKDAIERNIEFEPFKDLIHLKKYISSEDYAELNVCLRHTFSRAPHKAAPTKSASTNI